MKAIDKRVANLERATGADQKGTTVILKWFGSPVTGAVAYGESWARLENETVERFMARLVREAPWPRGVGCRIIKLIGESGSGGDAPRP